jgi:hypothetical protein
VPGPHDWYLWFADENEALPHSYVYHRDVSLEAGRTYHFLTRNLQPFTSANPDPVMYLVRGNEIVAVNDDYVGFASEIIYTPQHEDLHRLSVTDESTGRGPEISHTAPATYPHRLVIRAYSTASPGFCDVYQGVDGAPPSLLDSNVFFGGTYVRVRWKQGEWFETGLDTLYFGTVSNGGLGGGGRPAGDPYLFLIYPLSAVGSKMYWNDDGAGFPDSQIVPPAGGTGTVILASFSRYTSGECQLALVGQSYKAPWNSPGPWAFDSKPVARTPTVTKYLEELERQKPTLDKLSPGERDQGVLDLQRRMLPEEEIRRQVAPMPAVSTELVRRQELFLERHGQMESDLERMSYDERAAQLAQLKRETMGREYSEPEAPPSEGEAESR